VFNGNIAYGGTAALTNVGIPNGTARHATPVDFSAAGSEVKALSSSLAAYAASGTTTFQYGGLTLTGSDPGLNVFSVNGADLAAANSLIINAQPGSTVLVNVSGTVDQMQNFGFQINGTDRTNVLYNFRDASSLTLSGIGIEGSVLAPNAAVHFNNGQINGNLIAGSLDGPGESHNHLFNGNLPDGPHSTVPEPGTLSLLGASVLWASGMIVRKRK
jgi:choice-of-anchor A domain-containing protein